MIRVVSWNIKKSRPRLLTLTADLSAIDLLFLQENTKDLHSTREFDSSWTIYSPDNNLYHRHCACIAASSLATTSLDLHQKYPAEFKGTRDIIVVHAKAPNIHLLCVYNDARDESLTVLSTFLENNPNIANNCLMVGTLKSKTYQQTRPCGP